MKPLPEMTAVESSNIESIGYDPDDQQLFVEFKSGDRWRYDGVSEETWNEFAASESAGKAFYSLIKGKFESVQITGTAPNEADEHAAGVDVSQEGDDLPETESTIEQKESEAADQSDAVASEGSPDTASQENADITDSNDQQDDDPSDDQEDYQASHAQVEAETEEELNDGASSCVVSSWSHGDEAGTLFITMENGDKWKYPQAPVTLIKSLDQAEDPTKFYLQNIVARYEGEKVARAA